MRKSKTDSFSPLISVVIPCYNEELFITNCLDSLREQDFRGNFEIIVVDNGSSDRTAEIARQYGAKVVSEPKRGVCLARQAGTAAAEGEIIVATDADNIFPSDWLSRIWQGFLNNPEVVAISGPCKYRNVPWWGILFPALLFWSVKFLHRLTGNVWYISGCNIAFRKNIWPGYNVNLNQGGDEIDFLGRLKKKGKIEFFPDNFIFTSNRRLRRGMLYGLVVTIFWYYVVSYAIALLVGKSLSIFSWPAFRDEKDKAKHNWLILGRAAVLITFVLIIYFFQVHNAFARRISQNMNHRLDSLEDRMPWRR